MPRNGYWAGFSRVPPGSGDPGDQTDGVKGGSMDSAEIREALREITNRDRRFAELEAELARVKGERDRLFAHEIEFRAESTGRPPIRECLVALSLMRMGPLPPADIAALLAEHDRRSATEGER